eukprot:GHVN01003572.1.p1 GENE.GHVN01003572.1~~GHVN01003572.1.p1  ORF type:complete len:677 (-),score=67.30 GHVN01003572.1:563-2593(-)
MQLTLSVKVGLICCAVVSSSLGILYKVCKFSFNRTKNVEKGSDFSLQSKQKIEKNDSDLFQLGHDEQKSESKNFSARSYEMKPKLNSTNLDKTIEEERNPVIDMEDTSRESSSFKRFMSTAVNLFYGDENPIEEEGMIKRTKNKLKGLKENYFAKVLLKGCKLFLGIETEEVSKKKPEISIRNFEDLRKERIFIVTGPEWELHIKGLLTEKSEKKEKACKEPFEKVDFLSLTETKMYLVIGPVISPKCEIKTLEIRNEIEDEDYKRIAAWNPELVVTKKMTICSLKRSKNIFGFLKAGAISLEEFSVFNVLPEQLTFSDWRVSCVTKKLGLDDESIRLLSPKYGLDLSGLESIHFNGVSSSKRGFIMSMESVKKCKKIELKGVSGILFGDLLDRRPFWKPFVARKCSYDVILIDLLGNLPQKAEKVSGQKIKLEGKSSQFFTRLSSGSEFTEIDISDISMSNGPSEEISMPSAKKFITNLVGLELFLISNNRASLKFEEFYVQSKGLDRGSIHLTNFMVGVLITVTKTISLEDDGVLVLKNIKASPLLLNSMTVKLSMKGSKQNPLDIQILGLKNDGKDINFLGENTPITVENDCAKLEWMYDNPMTGQRTENEVRRSKWAVSIHWNSKKAFVIRRLIFLYFLCYDPKRFVSFGMLAGKYLHLIMKGIVGPLGILG